MPKSPLSDSRRRLSAVRAELSRHGLAGFLVPHADAHQGEYLPPNAQRLAWLTGFTGSAGCAVVLADAAAIFVDGRYSLQVRDQVDQALFLPRDITEEPPAAWIGARLRPGEKLGFDPWLHSEQQVETLCAAVELAGGALVPVADNPIDTLWSDRPGPPLAPVVAHPLEYAGTPSPEKRAELEKILDAKGAVAAILTLPDSIAWLLNVRGGDLPHTPLPLSFAIVHKQARLDWFIEKAKITADLAAHLGDGVCIRRPEDLGPAIDELGSKAQGNKAQGVKDRRVLADPATAAAWVFERLRSAGATVIPAADPCQLAKARKNPVELTGARAAHDRDGLALTRFLAWLDGQVAQGRARGSGKFLSEIEAAARLLEFRRENELFQDLSFGTISGSGPNGAIVHYAVTPKTDRRLGPGELYLVDSGAQYLDGTTDVTRTVAIGEPSAEMRDRFTRVLKGHIALATARFPRGTTGTQLDVLARHPLWQVGLDYDHGTGHGVGSYLSVHEGPQRISKAANSIALEPGMILSNEPGYYKAGAYGIRIENLVTVIESPGIESPAGPKDERPMLGFETLTMAPIDLRLVEPALLSRAETAWLDGYHARLHRAYAERVDRKTAAWLGKATRRIAG